ncbi:MAG: serine protein kinase PrkA [Kofleriaceae bacterium]|nr:serine protein kinase PrkA [Kofleriaceae bacterium]
MPSSDPSGRSLDALTEAVRSDFVRNRRVMSFAEYLDLVARAPRLQLRSAAQYLVDAFDHYGTREVSYPWGQVQRFGLFDAPWAGGDGCLFGQEAVQNSVYQVLRGFVRDGVASKVVMLHGPNGSAKSTFIRCLGRGVEHYSTQDDGAIYRFNWIFPKAKAGRGGIGFGGKADGGPALTDSFASLADDQIDARLVDELRDHPLLLIPAHLRGPWIDDVLAGAGLGGAFPVADYLRTGSLAAKNRTIYEALLAGYQGDYAQVLRHVQVERFYISQRYRTGWVTVEPQLSVDATERQITADRSITALPPSLASIALFEYGGEVVGANRGMIEYDDLLKRPLEAYKYLLTTVERGALAMANTTLFLDLVFIASCNDIHLSAFREMPDFQSFKGRFELIRVPYILDVRHEEALYRERLREAAGGRHVAPHTAYVAALWAVMSRMRKPQPDRFSPAVSEMINKLTPVHKVELYAHGRIPSELGDKARELTALTADLWHESDTYPIYEGRIGASPREMQAVILSTVGSARTSYVSPLVLLDELTELCKQASLYEFLRQDVQAGGFHDHRALIEVARERLLARVDDDVRAALGLIEESEYQRVFDRYINHVTHAIKKEKVRNPGTGRLDDPDEAMMREVEKTIEATGKADDFRGGLIAKIGAWTIDAERRAPGSAGKPPVAEIFSDLVGRLRDAYYERHKKAIAAGVGELLVVLSGNEGQLAADARERATRAELTLRERFGYSRESARDLVGALVSARYR